MLTYNEKTRQFERDGVVITAAVLRELIDKLTEYARKEARRLAKQVEAGTITPARFEAAMTSLITSSQIIAVGVGAGGASRADWGKAAKKVTWQSGFLGKFALAIGAGAVVSVAARAASYASAIYTTFANERFEERQTVEKEILVRLVTNSLEGCGECAADEAQGWMPVDEMGELGSRECGDWCKCDLVFSDEL